MNQIVLVAVYGTLKQGSVNYELHLPSHQPVWRGWARIPYQMYENREYPMVVPSEDEHSILIEVFDLDEPKLRELDILEEPYHYHRETVELPELGQVEIYVHPAPAPPSFWLVESGDWKEGEASYQRFRST